jgi:hypothetical protein
MIKIENRWTRFGFLFDLTKSDGTWVIMLFLGPLAIYYMKEEEYD